MREVICSVGSYIKTHTKNDELRRSSMSSTNSADEPRLLLGLNYYLIDREHTGLPLA